jgi:NADH dehydrogenase (ubiquinone) Fe-S protein 3
MSLNIFKILPKYGKFIPQVFQQNFYSFDFTVIVTNLDLISNLIFFKNHIGLQYKSLSCISGVDLLNTNYRFSVVYELISFNLNSRIRFKTFLNEYNHVFSITSVFVNANWWEREIWDLYGIFFYGHPDLRRIMTDYGFEGHPLRKDFPLSGFIELQYDFINKTILSIPFNLNQEYRSFNFSNSW